MFYIEETQKERIDFMEGKSRQIYGKDILISLLGSYVITFFGILVLALFLFFFQISEDVVDIGIIVIYVLACLFAGFVIGRRRKEKKYLWGMAAGGCYYILLILLSLILQSSLNTTDNNIVTMMFLCVGSGTLGGMVS